MSVSSPLCERPKCPAAPPRVAASVPRWARAALASCRRGIVALPALPFTMTRRSLVADLTLPVLAIYCPGVEYHLLLARLLCLGGLLYRPLLRLPAYWFALAALVGMGTYLTWHIADNHKYLMTYWCLVLGFVQAAPEERRDRVLAINARLLLGLCMALAVAWKVLTPAYTDGSFFQHTLLFDGRFKYVASTLADVPLASWSTNQEQQRELLKGYLNGSAVDTVPLTVSERLPTVAAAMTWWTVAIEGSLAVLFLWPTGGLWLGRLRHGLLVFFVYTTYAIAPVIPFGWMLVILGVAQCRPRRDDSAPRTWAFSC